MLNSWKKSTLPMPKRIQDLDLSFEFQQQLASTSKSVKPQTSGTKIVAKPMRTAELLKLFDFDTSPVVNKARKQLWSVSKSGSKKHNQKFKKTAIKENVRKTMFPKTSSRRTPTVKSNSADQSLPLIDMEDLENHPRKLKQPLRIPQSIVTNKSTMNPGAKRQTVYQTRFVKPAVKSSTETISTSVPKPANTVGQSKFKRQTDQQSYALKSVPEISVTKCDDTVNKSLPESVHELKTESVRDMFRQILCRMDKLEMMIQENQRCCKCRHVISPSKSETTKETTAQGTENSRENNTVDSVESIAQCNKKIVENITDSIESIITEKVTNNTVSETNNNIEKQIAHNESENVDNTNCVENLSPEVTVKIEEVSTRDLDEKNPTSDNIHHKNHFELLEEQCRNNSLTSAAFIDSDDSGSPVFQEIDYEYLLGGKGGDLTEIHTVNSATSRNNSTGSNDAIRTYNEMRKCIPMLCTPKISTHNNASLMTPSVQNSHKKILSRRIQEQLLMLNKKS